MINFDAGKGIFNYRSAAVILHEDHVLLHRAEQDEFWALPGGRVEFHEFSNNTITREIHEELGWQSRVLRHLWFLENFFEYNARLCHEVSNIYLVGLDNSPAINSEIDFKGIEEPAIMLFRWVPLLTISNYKTQPGFLQSRLNSLPNEPEHIQVGASYTTQIPKESSSQK